MADTPTPSKPLISDSALQNTGEIFKNYWMPATAATVGTGLLSGYLGSQGPKRNNETPSQRKQRILKDALLSSGLVGGSLMAGGLAGGILTDKGPKPEDPSIAKKLVNGAAGGVFSGVQDVAGGAIGAHLARGALDKTVNNEVLNAKQNILDRVSGHEGGRRFVPTKFKDHVELYKELVDKFKLDPLEADKLSRSVYKKSLSTKGAPLAAALIGDAVGKFGQQELYDSTGLGNRESKYVTPIVAGKMGSDLLVDKLLKSDATKRLANKAPGWLRFAGNALGALGGYGVSTAIANKTS